MGSFKKEAARKERQGETGTGIKVKGTNFYRNAKKVKTLKMFKDGTPQRDRTGKITQAASYQSREIPDARVEPNRKWFGSTRVIGQEALNAFRTAVAERASDPYQVLLKTNKLPMSLIRDGSTVNGIKQHQAKIQVDSEPFNEIFGPKSMRKRVKLGVGSLEDLADQSVRMEDNYLARIEENKYLSGQSGQTADQPVSLDTDDGQLTSAREPIFSKGQSKRIWNELYKTIDSSDVVIHVLDARDPLGTTCQSIIKYIKEEAPHKHLIFCLNKVDLIPTSVAAAWVRRLSKTYPTLAFHASITNSFGKGSLISLLRQFSSLHSSRKQISVGIIGYPNTGKSSIINALRGKKVCNVAPIPGETKVWQYITLMKRIYLIDCPGVVPPSQTDTEEEILLRGVVRVENVENPAQYIPAILKKVQPKHIERTYEIKNFDGDAIEFLSILAKKGGRLLRGGEADVDGVAKMVINDFLRGKLPWYTPPPKAEGNAEDEAPVEGREGRLGEMGKKRKLEDLQTVAEKEGLVDTVAASGPAASGANAAVDGEQDEESSFEGLDSNDEEEEEDANEIGSEGGVDLDDISGAESSDQDGDEA